MRRGHVHYNGVLAGTIQELNHNEYLFTYDEAYFKDARQPAVSLTLPKTQQTYRANHLFPFFFNLLSEGVNRELQSRQLKIDERDHFGFLLATAQFDTIGAITVAPIPDEHE